MITGVAFVPQAPALDPDVGRGLDVELGPLRAACAKAIRDVTAAGARVELLGAPESLELGRLLVSDAPEPAGTDSALVVLGDGSARRTEKAPGYLDDRAAPFDREVGDALASGDPARLAAIDADLGRELLAAGVAAWHDAAARLAGTSWQADLRYDDAPFGVGYFVAVWTQPGGRSA